MRVLSLVRACTTKVLEREVAVNEVFGFATRCALQSAGHTTDYVIDEGTAFMLGGPRTERLLELSVKAGYFKAKRTRAGVTTYLLVDDPAFLHMRTQAEIERDKQRKADNANKTITGPVRRRDGDECRYCGVIVNWLDRKSGRGGTYDHREPGKPATIETLVVACQACNGGRGDDPDADTRYPLRDEPAAPVYSDTTAAFLLSAGYRVTVTEGLRPGRQPDTAHRDPATSGTTQLPTNTRRAPVTAKRPNRGANGPPRSADIEHPGSGSAGTGRVGSGTASSSTATTPAARRRRRSPRGKETQQR